MAKSPKGTQAQNRNLHPLAPTAGAENTVPIGPARVAPPQRGTLRPKGGAQGGFKEAATAVHRANIEERMGPRHRVEVSLPGPQSPEARATQANGKIIPSVGGTGANFWAEGNYS